jgi:putative methyltransferase
MLAQERSITKNHAILIVYQLLFFKGQTSWGRFKKIVTRQKTRLRAELARVMIRKKVQKKEDLMPLEFRDQIVLPRYVRVNLAKMTVEAVISAFVKSGFTLEEPNPDVSCIKPKTIRRDVHLTDLLILSPKTDLHDHKLYLNGSLILQDKAVCYRSVLTYVVLFSSIYSKSAA